MNFVVFKQLNFTKTMY